MNYKETLRNSAPASTRQSAQPPFSMSTDGTALELDIELKNGDRYALPYAYKTAVHFNLSGTLTIYFSTHTVTVTGINLSPFYEALLQHTLTHIQDREFTFANLPEDTARVTSIVVEEA